MGTVSGERERGWEIGTRDKGRTETVGRQNAVQSREPNFNSLCPVADRQDVGFFSCLRAHDPKF